MSDAASDMFLAPIICDASSNWAVPFADPVLYISLMAFAALSCDSGSFALMSSSRFWVSSADCCIVLSFSFASSYFVLASEKVVA